MKKVLLFTLFCSINFFTYAQGKGYVITIAKDTVFCDDIVNGGFIKIKVKCTTKGEEKTFTPKELFAFKIKGNYSVIVDGKYKGYVLMENKKYKLTQYDYETDSGTHSKYFVVDADHKTVEEMPRGKKASEILSKYFGDCAQAKDILKGYKQDSQKAVFSYDRFYSMVNDYNGTACRNQ